MVDKWTNRNLIRQALRQHCKPEDNYALSKRLSWFLTLKFILCLILNRERIKPVPAYNDHVVVAVIESGSFNHYDFGQAYWWETVNVGYGYFKNWWYLVSGDQSI